MSESDEFATPILHGLRRKYRAAANPAAVLDLGLLNLAEAGQLAGAETSSGLAALESFLADVLLAVAKNTVDIHQAETLSASALRRLEVTQRPTKQHRALAVHTALLNSIAHKASGDIDLAFSAIEQHTAKLSSKLRVDWSELAPLRRQLVLLSQREDAFVALANESASLRELEPTEYYANLKRFFEFLLNRRKIDLASVVFPVLRAAYLTAASRLSPLGHVSFLKNTGQFVVMDGYPRKGTALLYQALRAASQFQMHGQVRQINRLISESQNGHPTLESFRLY